MKYLLIVLLVLGLIVAVIFWRDSPDHPPLVQDLGTCLRCHTPEGTHNDPDAFANPVSDECLSRKCSSECCGPNRDNCCCLDRDMCNCRVDPTTQQEE